MIPHRLFDVEGNLSSVLLNHYIHEYWSSSIVDDMIPHDEDYFHLFEMNGWLL